MNNNITFEIKTRSNLTIHCFKWSREVLLCPMKARKVRLVKKLIEVILNSNIFIRKVFGAS